MRRGVLGALLALCAAGCAPPQAPRPALPSALPAMTVPPGASITLPTRSNAAIATDILDLAFQMESGRELPVLTRFDGPVTVGVLGPAPPTLQGDLSRLVARLGREAGLPVARVAGTGRITVQAVPRADLASAVPGAACFVVPGVSSWVEYTANRASPALDWARLTRRERAAIFVPADEAPQELRDCLHEELAQALGPLNDLWRLPDSVFNDDNVHGALTSFDMLVLRTLYDPSLANGMSRAQVAARLPRLLARLNPAGQGVGGGPGADPGTPWQSAIETALSGTASRATRISAARRAVALSQGTGTAQEGFALYTLARNLALDDLADAEPVFLRASVVFARLPQTQLHEAKVRVHLAAAALARGDAAAALALAQSGSDIAERFEDAELRASFGLIAAEALALAGQNDAAAAARLDSLGWARYGLGRDGRIAQRQAGIAALAPRVTAPDDSNQRETDG